MPTCPICAETLPPAHIAAPDRGQGTPGRFEVAICRKCGAGVTLPQVSNDELAAFYPSSYGPHSELEIENGILALISRTIRRRLAAMADRRPPLAALRDEAPGHGLDVGAGRGDTAAALSARGWKMTAIDPAPAAVEAMRARGIDGREGVLSTVSLPAAQFGFALFQHSLEHTTDPLADLHAAHDALRPGGLVLISVPNFGSWQRRWFGGAWFHLDVPRHRVHFAQSTLARALRDAGFVEARFARSSSAVGLPASLQYRIVGRCVFPGGMRLRIAAGMCALTLPLTWALDHVVGEADTLHVVARKPVTE